MQHIEQVITATSPATASTVVHSVQFGNLDDLESLTIIADIRGATGGTLDVYLQTTHDGGATWFDFAHTVQLTAGAAQVRRAWHVNRATPVTASAVIGTATTPALAADTIVGGSWGDALRIVFVAGVSTTAGASQTIRLYGKRKGR
jgi:hypothetical protein